MLINVSVASFVPSTGTVASAATVGQSGLKSVLCSQPGKSYSQPGVQPILCLAWMPASLPTTADPLLCLDAGLTASGYGSVVKKLCQVDIVSPN